MADCSCWTNNCTAACNYGSCAYHQCQSSCQGGCGGGCRGCGGCDGGCSGCSGTCKNGCKDGCKDSCGNNCTGGCSNLCNTSCSNSVAQDLANLILSKLIVGLDMNNVQSLLLQEASRRPSISQLPNPDLTFTGAALNTTMENLIENLNAVGKTISASNIAEAGAIISRSLGREIIALATEAAKETITTS